MITNYFLVLLWAKLVIYDIFPKNRGPHWIHDIILKNLYEIFPRNRAPHWIHDTILKNLYDIFYALWKYFIILRNRNTYMFILSIIILLILKQKILFVSVESLTKNHYDQYMNLMIILSHIFMMAGLYSRIWNQFN